MNGHQPRPPGGRVVCRVFAAGQVCSYGTSCRFSHEVVASVSWGGGGSGGGRGRGRGGGGGGRGDGGGGRGGRHHHHHHPPHHHHHGPAYRSRVWHPPHQHPHPQNFRLMSYNVLADALARVHAAQLYPRADPSHLSWRHRWRLVEEEIAWLKPDVLCLQEVDAARWPEVLRALRAQGYEGAHGRRTGDRADGCAVLWRRDAFEALPLPGGVEEDEEDEGEGEATTAPPPPHHVLRFAEWGLRDNVAVSALLRPRRQGQQQQQQQQQQGRRQQHHHEQQQPKRARSAEAPPKQDSFLLLVSTTHLIFNPKRGDTKLGQLRTLLAELHGQAHAVAAAAEQPPTAIFPVVCGDLNAAPGSAVYAFTTTGRLDCLSCDRRSLSGVVECSGPDSPFRVWGAAQRRHYLEREAFSAAAAAAAAAGIGGGGYQQQQHRQSGGPPPLDAEALLLGNGGRGPLPWLRPPQRRLFEAEVAPPEERKAGVPLALLERFGWDAEGMAQATGEEFGRRIGAGTATMKVLEGGGGDDRASGEEDEDVDEDEDDEDESDDDEDDEDEEDEDEEALPALKPGAAAPLAAPVPPPLVVPSACVARHPWPGGLASAYATVTGREPPVTSVHAKFAGTLDYVLYHERGVSAGGAAAAANAAPPLRLRPARVLMPPPLRLLLPPRAPPSAGVPSDHVSVVVDFEVGS